MMNDIEVEFTIPDEDIEIELNDQDDEFSINSITAEDFDFSIFGFKGDKGDIGETPNISATASISGGVGTPSVSVTRSGSDEEPILSFAFSNLKGDKGDPGAIKFEIVVTLPTTGADDTIYLVPITPDTTGNNYAEYIYINGQWELLGKIGVQVDLSNYYTKAEVNSLIPSLTDYVKNTDYASSSTGGVIKVQDSLGLGIGSTGNLYASAKSYATYLSSGDATVIGKGTLENVITGKDLTTKSYVDGLVGDINSAIDSINGEVI